MIINPPEYITGVKRSQLMWLSRDRGIAKNMVGESMFGAVSNYFSSRRARISWAI